MNAQVGMPNPATRMTPQWIADAVRMNPVTPLLDKEGKPDGNFRTCPVRLDWIDLFEPEKPKKQKDGTMSAGGKYGATLIFPVGADVSLLEQAAINLAYQKKPEAYDQNTGLWHGVHMPFRDQREKCMQSEGYMPGGKFTATKTKFQPQILMPGPLDPATGQVQWIEVKDPAKVYSGVWAICVVNAFWFDVGVKKGVSFGLQNVCLISDDQKLGGGGGTRDARKDFAGVSVAPGADFSKMMASAPMAPGAPQSPMGIMPAPTPIYQQPAAPLAVPGLPPAAPALTAEQEELRSLGLPY